MVFRAVGPLLIAFLGVIQLSQCRTYTNVTKVLKNLENPQNDVPSVIRSKGYPCEEHTVITEDQYILTLHRIPHGREDSKWPLRKRTPIFLQHGLLSSSASWTLDLSIRTPAFIFADHGYDVWLGNARGNVYSRQHVVLSADDKAFWQFSFDEMGYYDIPASIDYILNVTEYSQLYYVGHSMGTTMFFAGMSKRPEYNSKIKEMFALAPVAKVTHLKPTLGHICPLNKYIQEAFEFAGSYLFLPGDSKFLSVSRLLCDHFDLSRLICEGSIFSLIGYDWNQFHEDWVPAVLNELLSGTSIYSVIHYAQENVADKFQHFDHRENNMQVYGQNTPPEYNLSAVTAPVSLVYASNDYLAPPEDVQFLVTNLPNLKRNWLVEDKQFNHLDFLWAVDSYAYVYNPILKAIGHF